MILRWILACPSRMVLVVATAITILAACDRKQSDVMFKGTAASTLNPQLSGGEASRPLYVAEFSPSKIVLDDTTVREEFWEKIRFARFWATAQGRLKGAMLTRTTFLGDMQRDGQSGILVLVHGYNTDVPRAIAWARDLPKLINSHTATLLFRWPSTGDLFDFKSDKWRAFMSGSALAILLSHLQTLPPGSKPPIDIIAFSLGNLVLARAIVSTVGEPVRRIILLAPAVDETLVREVAMWGQQPTEGTTVYVSGRDIALWLARRLGEHPPGPTTLSLGKWDIVDVSAVCVPSLSERFHFLSKVEKSHYYLSCPTVAHDAELILSGLDPVSRGLEKTTAGWRLVPRSGELPHGGADR
jgi:esterase/lipase superfamily enzyme